MRMAENILSGVFILIVLFLLANNWPAFDAYVSSFSRFTQNETQILQGRSGPGGRNSVVMFG